MKDEFVSCIGIFGQRHYRYLKENKPNTINVMRMNGTLKQYLHDIDRVAEEMFSQLVKQFAENEGITEQMKTENQTEWVCRMENIRNRATEIVNSVLIYS